MNKSGELQHNIGWKLEEYFEDLFNIDTQEQIAVHMCGFDSICNCFKESQLEELKLR